MADYLSSDGALVGPAQQIAADLARDPALRQVSDLLISFVPGVPDHAEHRRLLTATTQELAPLLGWRPGQRLQAA